MSALAVSKSTTGDEIAGKVYYRSQSRSRPSVSPEPTPPFGGRIKTYPQGGGSSTQIFHSSLTTHLGGLAAHLHSSQERENEVLGRLMSSLGAFAHHQLEPSPIVFHGKSLEVYGGRDASQSAEEGMSASPVVSRRGESTAYSQRSWSHNSPEVAVVVNRTSDGLQGDDSRTPAHPERLLHSEEGTTSFTNVSDYMYSTANVPPKSHSSCSLATLVQSDDVVSQLRDENEFLREECVRFRERSEAQQDHINRLLACIKKYESTLPSHRASVGVRVPDDAEDAVVPASTPSPRGGPPRYLTHTTSSLYRRQPTASSQHRVGASNVGAAESAAMTVHSGTSPTGANNERHRHFYAYEGRGATTASSRHRTMDQTRRGPASYHVPPVYDDALLSESTLELLLMAEQRIADGSSFLSP